MPKSRKQIVVLPKTTVDPHIVTEESSFFNPDGTPITFTPFVSVTTATAIGTAAKTTTTKEPLANTLVAITFTSGNSVAAPTVAFNGGTARAIQLGGTAPASGEVTIAASGIGFFFFDGTVLHQIGVYS